MAKKTFWVGMLVLLLVFGMTVVGCDNGTTGNGNGNGGNGGNLSVTGLSEFNGHYAHFVNNFGDFTLALMGMSNFNLQNETVTLP